MLPNFVLSKTRHESKHSESEFYYTAELSQEQLLQSPTHSKSKERNLTSLAKKVTTFSEANKQTGGQGNNLPDKLSDSFWNKQTVLRRNFFPWKASKISLWVKSKKIEEENKIRYHYFFRVYRVSWRSWLHQKNHKHILCALG